MSATARHPLMMTYLVAVILLAWWPWNFWLVFFAGFRSLRRAYKRAMTRDAASEAARRRNIAKELDALARLSRQRRW